MAASRTTLRSIGAVVAGLLFIVVTSTLTDHVLHSTGVYAPYGQPMAEQLFILALAYRAVYGVAGGYITARLAPARPLFHTLILGAIGVVIGAAGAVATWNRGPEFGPHWYPILLILITIPCSWAGAALLEARSRRPSLRSTYAR